MIESFGDRRTERFAQGQRVPAFSGFEAQARRRLAVLDQARSTNDLAALPSNRFEALRGDLAGHFSVRINRQWRLVFVWPEGAEGPSDVRIMDYH
jgi:proteic killer suppression protein